MFSVKVEVCCIVKSPLIYSTIYFASCHFYVVCDYYVNAGITQKVGYVLFITQIKPLQALC